MDRPQRRWLFEPGELGPLLRFGGPYPPSRLRSRALTPTNSTWGRNPTAAFARSAHQLLPPRRKRRLAAVNTGVPASDFSPVTIIDPGPDGIPGTFDDQTLTVYQQNPASFGKTIIC